MSQGVDARATALVRAYDLVECAQLRDCTAELGHLLDLASERGWPDVAAVVHFAYYAGLDTTAPQLRDRDSTADGAELHLSAMAEAAAAFPDRALTALCQALRATVTGWGIPVGCQSGTRDLARAVALLDEDGGSSVHAASAYNVCGLAFHRRGLWELALEMYDSVTRIVERSLPAPFDRIADLNRRTAVVNRLSAAVPLCCLLTESGQREAAAAVAANRARPTAQSLQGLPTEWVVEVRSVGYLLAAIAREPESAQDADLLLTHHSDHGAGGACIHVGRAIRALDAGDRNATARHAERALTVMHPDHAAGLLPLALSLATAAEAPNSSWRRYAEHTTRMRWDSRQLVLAATRNQTLAEKVLLDNQRLTERAYVDELTGLANRHAYSRHLERLRQAQPDDELTVLMVDVDWFKEVNDTFGHPAGDEALRRLGALLVETTRATDLAVRLGGDEFLLLISRRLPDAERRGHELLDRVMAYPWHEVAPGLSVGLSIGVISGPATEVDDLIAAADQGLYSAKSEGRGRVVLLDR
ncbi:MAG: GGDEF domain-containing protein [Kineosporiaceae bacterium]|nr:GGDEF domain-containing protein [Kineosporiaceae bacterium]